MQTKNFSMTMSDGKEIWVNRWLPDTEEEIKGIVQLHHGLAEHSMRYDRLGSVLAEKGYILNAYDMRGHGRTAENAEKNGTGIFGKLADKNGYKRVVEDLNEMIEGIKKDFPEKKVILLGHSFGSLVAQSYIENYGKNINGCILCGTTGPRRAASAVGKFFTKATALFRGRDSKVPLLEKLAFGSYNKIVENPTTKNDWVSTSKSNVQMYNMDNWCGFPLTTSFYIDMTSLTWEIHSKANMKKVPSDLPVFFIYGAKDPVGSCGKTIEKLYNIYKKNGVQNLEIKAYENDSHEIFNEDDKEVVENDLINWISKL